MADFRGHPVSALYESSSEDQPAPYPRADGDVQHRLRTAPRPEAPFSDRNCIGVVSDDNAPDSKRGAQSRFEQEIGPPRHMKRSQHPVGPDMTTKRDTDTLDGRRADQAMGHRYHRG